jgi:hypothetical protein
MMRNTPVPEKSSPDPLFFGLPGGATAPLYDLIEKRAPFLKFSSIHRYSKKLYP